MLAPPSNSSSTLGEAPEVPLVLIIEDDDDTRFLYAESLAQVGYRVAGEGDGASGIEAAFRLRPDAILLDLAMPGIGGVEAIRKLRADPRTRDCLIVVATGSGMKQFAAATEAGCDVFCGKPFDPSAISHLLRVRPVLVEKPESALPLHVVKRCSCGLEFTRPQWLALARCGRMHLVRRHAVVEVRNCSCGSTLALQVDAPQESVVDGWTADGHPGTDTALQTIVVVERDVHVRRLVLHFIGSTYVVEFLDDGYAALDRVRKSLPAVLVAEIMIPRLDGLALCRLLKGDSSTANVPVLLLSVLAASARAKQAGADAFLPKPLEKQLFVSSLLGLAERRDQ